MYIYKYTYTIVNRPKTKITSNWKISTQTIHVQTNCDGVIP